VSVHPDADVLPDGAVPQDPEAHGAAPEAGPPGSGAGRILAWSLGGAGAVLLVVVVATWWAGSRMPAAYSVDSMGVVDLGLGSQVVGQGHGHGTEGHGGEPAATVSVTDLRADPSRPADVRVELVARAGPVVLADGRTVPGYSLNGSSPGPVVRAVQGDLVEVAVRNESVAAGMTLHWHGMSVPNAADGVAGVTQDAIAMGQTYVYRFVARDAGTYWYHSHQVSHEQVIGGLLGAVVVQPAGRPAEPPAATEAVALVHTYRGVRTINGRAGQSRVPAAPGEPVRVRVINTDNGPMPVWVSGAGFQVAAIDGSQVNGPQALAGRSVVLTAGARADLLVQVPDTGAAAVEVAGTSLVLGDGPPPSSPAPKEQVDPLTYGQPAPVGFDPEAPDRRYEYRIGRSMGFLDGRPGMWWTINGAMFPDVPMFVISQGEVARFTISNDSGEVHPMHLHGHRSLVLSRDGVPATGSPWWVDSLNVEPGQTYDTAFIADNPGIWMDHCHNLPHAADGLVAHLMYQGVTTPFVIGGDHTNEPE
jgi:FtsP/CotA-like multicopper oxidase with cupredoxin domain